MSNLLLKLRKTYPEKYSLIKKAYDFAYTAHLGQKRVSGEDYFIHPCAVVEILADFGFDSSTIVAAFLHDVLEDTVIGADELRKEFGEEIFELVDGVTKLEKLQFVNKKEQQAENFRKIFMAMAKDLRVIIIKLADRLHNMRSLQYLPPEKQQYIAQETLDVYAPLAGRLGISFFKCELEDTAMMYLMPEKYREVTTEVMKRRTERQGFLDIVSNRIREKLDQLGIKGEVNGRPKHFYSVYKKMVKNNIGIDEIYDLLAVRIIVDSVKDCYTMLGAIHNLWKPIPGRFKDYIAMPKANNYQSLHTTVITQFNETFEIQIRTHEMHAIAEYGIAAHWKYKEGKTAVETELDSKVRWLREVVEAQRDIGGAEEFMDAVKINVFDDEVFVFTPKGDVYDLPVGSTAVDLAYKIHSEVGNHCIGAKVNKRIVPLTYKLQTGDIVDIITSTTSKGPSFDWLHFVRTASAKSKIRAFFKKEMKEENIARGKEMLDKEAKRRGYILSEIMSQAVIIQILQKQSLTEEDDMYAAIGYGGISTNVVLSRLIDNFKQQNPKPIPVAKEKKSSDQRSKSGILINGNANFSVRIAQCCTPVPGNEIIGYVSRGRGVSVHRKDCINIKGMEENRLIKAEWDVKANDSFYSSMVIRAEKSLGIPASITALMSNSKIPIHSAVLRNDEKEQITEITITIEIHNTEELDNLVRKIMAIKGVLEVRR